MPFCSETPSVTYTVEPLALNSWPTARDSGLNGACRTIYFSWRHTTVFSLSNTRRAPGTARGATLNSENTNEMHKDVRNAAVTDLEGHWFTLWAQTQQAGHSLVRYQMGPCVSGTRTCHCSEHSDWKQLRTIWVTNRCQPADEFANPESTNTSKERLYFFVTKLFSLKKEIITMEFFKWLFWDTLQIFIKSL